MRIQPQQRVAPTTPTSYAGPSPFFPTPKTKATTNCTHPIIITRCNSKPAFCTRPLCSAPSRSTKISTPPLEQHWDVKRHIKLYTDELSNVCEYDGGDCYYHEKQIGDDLPEWRKNEHSHRDSQAHHASTIALPQLLARYAGAPRQPTLGL